MWGGCGGGGGGGSPPPEEREVPEEAKVSVCFSALFPLVFWIFHGFSMEAGGRQKMWGGVGGAGAPPTKKRMFPKKRMFMGSAHGDVAMSLRSGLNFMAVFLHIVDLRKLPLDLRGRCV